MKFSSHFLGTCFRRALLALVCAIATFAVTPARADLLFDNFTGATSVFTGSTPRTYMAGTFDLSLPPESTGALITGGTFYIFSATAQAYSNLQLNIQFWDEVLATSGTGPAFGTPVGGVQSFDESAFTFTAPNQLAFTTVTFSTPIFLSANTTHAVTNNVKGDTGSGLQDTNNLTAALRITNPYAVGSSPINGFFRNASGATDMNFLGSDFRTFASPSNVLNNMAFKLEGTIVVPEPATWALLAGLGVLVAAMGLRRSKRA